MTAASSELRISDAVTHVVVFAGRTAKGLLARLSGRFVMSVDWIDKSMRRGQLLPEKGFGQ